MLLYIHTINRSGICLVFIGPESLKFDQSASDTVCWLRGQHDSTGLFDKFCNYVPQCSSVSESPSVWRNTTVRTQSGEAAGSRCNNNNNVHLSFAHQRPERSHDTY